MVNGDGHLGVSTAGGRIQMRLTEDGGTDMDIAAQDHRFEALAVSMPDTRASRYIGGDESGKTTLAAWVATFISRPTEKSCQPGSCLIAVDGKGMKHVVEE